MCAICGCGSETASVNGVVLQDPDRHGHGVATALLAERDHVHQHGSYDHQHHHEPIAHGRILSLEQDLLAKNQLFAERNRGWFVGRGVFAVNLMSSPGAGKTTLLERTIRDLGHEISLSVLEGDQATNLDAERISAAGATVVQINTGTGCHLTWLRTVSRICRLLQAPWFSSKMLATSSVRLCST